MDGTQLYIAIEKDKIEKLFEELEQIKKTLEKSTGNTTQLPDDNYLVVVFRSDRLLRKETVMDILGINSRKIIRRLIDLGLITEESGWHRIPAGQIKKFLDDPSLFNSLIP